MKQNINQAERKAALDNMTAVIRHLMNRVNSVLGDAEELMSRVGNPDEVLAEINRASNIAGKAQQAASMWKGLVIDWRMNEPKQEEAQAASQT